MQKINVQTRNRTNTIWLSNVNLSRVNHYTIPVIAFSEWCDLCLEIFLLNVHKFGNKICHPFLLRKYHSGGELWQLESVQEEVSFSGMWGRRLHLESIIHMHLDFVPPPCIQCSCTRFLSNVLAYTLWVLVDCPSEFKVLDPIVTLEHRDALCVKELYRHSWKFYQCLKYRSSLIHKKNDSSLLRVEYSMQQTCWERGGFWYILQTVSCSLSTFPNIKIYSYLLHMYTLPQIFSELSPTRCKVRGWFAKLGDLQN